MSDTHHRPINFSEDWDDAVLACPRCGCAYLHHGKVTVFNRPEDGKTTAVSTVEAWTSATHTLPSNQTANPSSRRQGIAIAVECEECGDGLELTIAQHKGATTIAWRVVDKPISPEQLAREADPDDPEGVPTWIGGPKL